VVEKQKKKLQEIRAERDDNAVRSSLEGLRKAARTDQNVMPFMLEAVKSYATLGEITKVLKDVFGEFKEPIGL
jgi:methylmalonyl-CoA mutase N-terminal domain/subunit